MAKVNGTFYTAQTLRSGTTPVSPPYDGSEGQQPPVTPSNPVDNNKVSYNVSDGKTDHEKLQARTNINVFSKEEVKAITGELADLTTVDKTNLVVAINLKGQYRAIEW